MEELTVKTLQRIMPSNKRNLITEEFIKNINETLKDDIHREAFRNNLVSYTSVLASGKYKVEDYVGAIKYVTFKLADMTNIEAFIRAFPDRYQSLVNRGYADKDINSAISSYHKNKLVTSIFESVQVPTYIVNMDLHQKAINRLADLMCNAKSEKVQCDSASKLVDLLKPPETQKIELDVGIKENDAMAELKEITAQLAAAQMKNISSGVVTAKEIADSTLQLKNKADIIEGELE